MTAPLKFAALLVPLVVALVAAQKPQIFAGVISDNMCARGDHSKMRMGSTDGECTNACVTSHGAVYVLFDGKISYTLKGKQPLEKFAGQKVQVVGTLDAKTSTIVVDSISAAK
jgi:hypothetical protein